MSLKQTYDLFRDLGKVQTLAAKENEHKKPIVLKGATFTDRDNGFFNFSCTGRDLSTALARHKREKRDNGIKHMSLVRFQFGESDYYVIHLPGNILYKLGRLYLDDTFLFTFTFNMTVKVQRPYVHLRDKRWYRDSADHHMTIDDATVMFNDATDFEAYMTEFVIDNEIEKFELVPGITATIKVNDGKIRNTVTLRDQLDLDDRHVKDLQVTSLIAKQEKTYPKHLLGMAVDRETAVSELAENHTIEDKIKQDIASELDKAIDFGWQRVVLFSSQQVRSWLTGKKAKKNDFIDIGEAYLEVGELRQIMKKSQLVAVITDDKYDNHVCGVQCMRKIMSVFGETVKWTYGENITTYHLGADNYTVTRDTLNDFATAILFPHNNQEWQSFTIENDKIERKAIMTAVPKDKENYETFSLGITPILNDDHEETDNLLVQYDHSPDPVQMTYFGFMLALLATDHAPSPQETEAYAQELELKRRKHSAEFAIERVVNGSGKWKEYDNIPMQSFTREDVKKAYLTVRKLEKSGIDVKAHLIGAAAIANNSAMKTAVNLCIVIYDRMEKKRQSGDILPSVFTPEVAV